MIKKYVIKIKGITPLIMHNGEGANPLDSRKIPKFLRKKFGDTTFREANKPLAGKRGKTDIDYKNLAVLGFYSSLYLNAVNKLIYPAQCFEKAIRDQATEIKKGRHVQRGVVVTEDSVLDFPNKNKSLESLYELHRYDQMVKVQQSKNLRTRAIFHTWKAEFNIDLITKVLDLHTLREILELGKIYGSMERRPRFGRYVVESIKEIKK